MPKNVKEIEKVYFSLLDSLETPVSFDQWFATLAGASQCIDLKYGAT